MVARRIGVLTVVVGALALGAYGISAVVGGKPFSFDLVARIGCVVLLVLALCFCTGCFALFGTAETRRQQEWCDLIANCSVISAAITLMVIPGILLVLLLGAGHVCLSTGSCGHGGRSGGIGR